MKGGVIVEIIHASGEEVKNPLIIVTEYTRDFSWGFYCTQNKKQAVRWAKKRKPSPTLNYYEFTPSDDLKILKFDRMDDSWLDFIAECRLGKIHDYDVVEGPMADDQIWDYAKDYINGKISREAFFVLAKFRYPTHQICFNTVKALRNLKFLRSEQV